MAVGNRKERCFCCHSASAIRTLVKQNSAFFLSRRFDQRTLRLLPKPLRTSSIQPVPLRSSSVSLGFELARWSTRCPPRQLLRQCRVEAPEPSFPLVSLYPLVMNRYKSNGSRKQAHRPNGIYLPLALREPSLFTGFPRA